jgi:hypothetical protein
MLPKTDLVTGYLYDWHEPTESQDGSWYVGVVQEELTRTLIPTTRHHIAG